MGLIVSLPHNHGSHHLCTAPQPSGVSKLAVLINSRKRGQAGASVSLTFGNLSCPTATINRHKPAIS
jgi:hypothetical protein